ncbi:unnamed protein product, partial [marine sediment metagenome]
ANKSWCWTGDNAVAAINTWHHYAFTFNAGTFAFYVDGVAIDATETQGNTGTVINNDDCPVLIGGRFSNSGTPAYEHYFDGKIGDVMIFSKVLSAVDIKNLYELTKWRFQK